MSRPKSEPARMTAAERRRKAVELRKAGASLKTIAGELGVTFQAVSKMIHKELAELAAATEKDAETLRQIEVERLDAMLLGLWNRARHGHEGAVDRVLRIMQRRAALLGLDAPTKSETLNINPEELDDRDLEAEVWSILERRKAEAESA